MWDFNLVVTLASDGRFHHLLDELNLYGDFHKTEFFGVILGRVAKPLVFLEMVQDKRTRQLVAFQDLGRIVPVTHCFTFQPETFLERAQQVLSPYIDRLGGQRFYVRLERRGLKGRIISPDAEQTLDTFLIESVTKAGNIAEIDFNDPDLILVIETVGERGGVGMLTKDLMVRYDFVRVP